MYGWYLIILIIEYINNITDSMDPKSGKVFLPSTIEQFTAQKKKNSKPGNLIKSLI